MPILHVQIAGQAKTPDGKTLQVPPPVALLMRGPVLQVSVTLEQSAAKALLQQGKQVPEPKTGWALIDTGASATCVDEQVAKDLGLPVIDTGQMASASHAQSDCNVYPVQINVPPLLSMSSPRTVGASRATRIRLAGIVRRSQRKRTQGRSRTTLGQCAEHDDRHLGVQLAQLNQRLQAVHHRHLDIQSNQVRMELRDLGQRDSAVTGRSNDLQLRIFGQGVAEQLANDH